MLSFAILCKTYWRQCCVWRHFPVGSQSLLDDQVPTRTSWEHLAKSVTPGRGRNTNSHALRRTRLKNDWYKGWDSLVIFVLKLCTTNAQHWCVSMKLTTVNFANCGKFKYARIFAPQAIGTVHVDTAFYASRVFRLAVTPIRVRQCRAIHAGYKRSVWPRAIAVDKQRVDGITWYQAIHLHVLRARSAAALIEL